MMRRVLFVIVFVCTALVARAAGPDRAKAPEPGPVPRFQFPKMQKLALSNGVPLLFVERHEVPLIQIGVVLRAGAWADPPARPGLASLTVDMLERGAGNRSALEISDALDTLGGQVHAATTWDATAVEINVPSAHIAEAVELLSDLVLHPSFPGQELERIRQKLLTKFLQRRDQPRELADFAAALAVYAKHPYGRPLDGTELSIRMVNRNDLQAFHGSFYAPGNSTLLVVGDTTAERVLPILEKAFGSWKAAPRGKTVPRPIAAARQVSRREIWLVDKPGAAQSEIRIARVGPPRTTTRYLPLQVLNTILGGSFTSRLNHNLRTEHGYAYYAYSAFDFRLSTGPFIAMAAVQTDKTGLAVSEVFKELNAIHVVSPEDLRKAKKYVALRYPAAFQTTGEVAEKVAERVIYSLPDGYFDEYLARVEAVTSDDVSLAAAEIDPERVAVIVVGDASLIQKEIANLRLGPIRRLSVDQLLGPALPKSSAKPKPALY
jgi:zinc protease